MYVCMYVCMDVWMYGCMDVWMYGCMDVWMYGCMDVCMDAWMHGCMDAWMHGCMDAWMHMYARMHTLSVGGQNQTSSIHNETSRVNMCGSIIFGSLVYHTKKTKPKYFIL